MDSQVIEVRTGGHEVVHDLTGEPASGFLAEVGRAGDGLLHVWVPHATAGLAVLETGAGSDDDLLAALRELLPADDRWRHRHGSPGHGRDHVLPALVPAVRDGAGPRRADGPRHLAVGLPGRPQRRQPGAPGAAVVPVRLTAASGGTACAGGRGRVDYAQAPAGPTGAGSRPLEAAA